MSQEPTPRIDARPRTAELPDKDPSAQIIAAINSIRYGSVEIVIHDGKIVQIERKEKVRLVH